LFEDKKCAGACLRQVSRSWARGIMTSNVITVPPESSLAEIAKILEDNRIKRVPVVRGGKLEGIIKRGNLLQA
jgi:CBS domain-containing protein